MTRFQSVFAWHEPCFFACVQKAEQITRLFGAFLARQKARWLVSFLLLATITANAGQPVAKSTPQSAGSDSKISVPKDSETESSTNYMALSGAELEKQIHPPAESPLTLFHKNLSAHDRSDTCVSVEAGYGQVWRDEFTLQREFTKRQQPTFAYVTASFSF